MSVHDRTASACGRSSQSWNPQPRRAASAVRGQASGRAAAATDACPGQSPLALELPAAQDAVDAWGSPAAMSAQPRPPRHAPTVAESTKELTAEGARVTTTVTGSATTAPAPPEPPRAKRMAGSLGVLRLDYDYPPAPGDIDHPFSFAYDVFYRVVPGLTFEIQAGAMPADVEARFVEKVQELDALGVSGITGDCGFMMYFQALARRHTKKPVFLSALAVLPAVTCALRPEQKVAIFLGERQVLEPMRALIRDECGCRYAKKTSS